MMGSPDPKYTRPSLSAKTHASLGVLASASVSGDVEKVRELAARNDSALSLINYLTDGLAAAIGSNQIEVVRYLLDNGADPNDRLVTVMTSKSRSLPILEALLERGWDVNTLILYGISILSYVMSPASVTVQRVIHFSYSIYSDVAVPLSSRLTSSLSGFQMCG